MREFRNVSRLGKTRVWRIWTQGDQIFTEYGDLDGKMTRVQDTALPKNVGKSNAITGPEQALILMERQILKKTRKGYIELGTANDRVESFDQLDWDLLPENLCFYKPKNTLSAAMTAKLEAGTAWLARKRDGEAMIQVIPEFGTLSTYSRTMQPSHHKEELAWGARFQHLQPELKLLPEKTILLGEMVATASADDRWYVAEVLKPKTPESLARQEETGYLHYYVWDVAYLGNEPWAGTRTVRERYEFLKDLFFDGKYIHPVEFYTPEELRTYATEVLHLQLPESNVQMAMDVAACLGYEGWVVVDPDATYDTKAFNFRGKPDRPAGACKLKPEFEDDFIAMFDPDGDPQYGKWGRGRRQGQVGSVALYQYDTSGDLIYICECGGGMDDEFRAKYSDPTTYPLTLQVKYTSRTYIGSGRDTNALQFPRIVRIRTDKTVDECINPEL